MCDVPNLEDGSPKEVGEKKIRKITELTHASLFEKKRASTLSNLTEIMRVRTRKIGLARSRLLDIFKKTFLKEQHLSILNMHRITHRAC